MRSVSLLLFFLILSGSTTLWSSPLSSATSSSPCSTLLVPVITHGQNGEHVLVAGQSLQFTTISGSNPGVYIFNENGSNLGRGAVQGLPTQGIANATPNSTATIVSCTDSFWDLNMVIRSAGNTVGDYVKVFHQDPVTGTRDLKIAFSLEATGVRVIYFGAMVAGSINDRSLSSNYIAPGNQDFIPFSNGATPVMTFNIMAGPGMVCNRLAFDLVRSSTEGTLSVVIADVVLNRDKNGPLQSGLAINPDGSLSNRTETYSTGLLCDSACPSCPSSTCPPKTSVNSSGFNGTSISSSYWVWFNSNLSASGIPKDRKTTVFFTNSTVKINNTTYAVPNGKIIFDPAVTCASTVYTLSGWVTTIPTSGSDEIFLAGLGVRATSEMKSAKVAWQGDFSADTPGVTIKWKWGAAVYNSDMTQYSSLLVQPSHGNACAGNNSHHAGTPENRLGFLVPGARGGGGSNFTGSWSGSQSVPLCDNKVTNVTPTPQT